MPSLFMSSPVTVTFSTLAAFFSTHLSYCPLVLLSLPQPGSSTKERTAVRRNCNKTSISTARPRFFFSAPTEVIRWCSPDDNCTPQLLNSACGLLTVFYQSLPRGEFVCEDVSSDQESKADVPDLQPYHPSLAVWSTAKRARLTVAGSWNRIRQTCLPQLVSLLVTHKNQHQQLGEEHDRWWQTKCLLSGTLEGNVTEKCQQTVTDNVQPRTTDVRKLRQLQAEAQARHIVATIGSFGTRQKDCDGSVDAPLGKHVCDEHRCCHQSTRHTATKLSRPACVFDFLLSNTYTSCWCEFS